MKKKNSSLYLVVLVLTIEKKELKKIVIFTIVLYSYSIADNA